MEQSAAVSPDKIIEDTGGCGRFQVRMGITVHATTTVVSCSILSMILISSTPTWWCVSDVVHSNMTSCFDMPNTLFCNEETCYVNNTKCEGFEFGGTARTVVSEFELLCGLDYIPSTVMSLQTVGMFVGEFTAGQISDLFGRKPPYFAGLICLIIFNFTGFFSVNWIMFAVSRFFIGIGAGAFLAVQYCIVSEFSLAQWRAWITGFPSWPMQACLFALIAWLIQDWRYIQLFCCILGLPCLLTWFIIPESFRWYVAHDRMKDATQIIGRVAKFNNRPIPDIETLCITKQSAQTDGTKYTIIHLFKSKSLAKTTALLSVNWFALGLVYYGITFAIQALSGNIYLNLFLFNIVSIPSKLMTVWLTNRFGRTKSTILCFVGVAISGFVVGIVQVVDSPHSDTVTNVFAVIASMSINMAWGPVQAMTIEVYPTVIRTVGFGSMSVIARIGAVLGPQFVYLNTYVPGLLFIACGGIAMLCIVSQIFLPETRDSNLHDTLYQNKEEVLANEETV